MLLGAVAPAAFRLVTSSSIQPGRVGDKRGGRSRELPVFSGAGPRRWFFFGAWAAWVLGSAARWGSRMAVGVLATFFWNSWSVHRGGRVLLGAVAPAVSRLAISSSTQSGRVGDRRGGRLRALPVFSDAARVG